MYEGNGDNPGTPEERAVRCAAACHAKKSPLSGSWSGFVALGFIVIPTSGRCYCESAASADCKRTGTSEYDRYDWGKDHTNECLSSTNGGCDSNRECTKSDGTITCGDCAAPWVNDGPKKCKEPGLIKVFDGECTDGSEIRMYNGDGDNPGSAEERAVRCSNACRDKQTPKAGSWDGFVALGFISLPSNGRCWCESSNAFTCSHNSGDYDRFAWATQDVAHTKQFDGECTNGSEIRMYEGNGDNPGTPEERAVRCSAACRNKKAALSGSWTGFVATGFIVIPTNGRCYCESAESASCSRTGTSEYDRYDWN